MELRRVVIRDRYPIFEAALYTRPLNRAALLAAVASCAVQGTAIGVAIAGLGKPAGWLQHLAFASVAALWLALGVLVFLQRRARRTGQLFLLSASAGALFLSLGRAFTVSPVLALLYAVGLLLLAPLLLSFVRAFDEQRPWSVHELWLYLPALGLAWPSAANLFHDKASPAWRAGLILACLYLIAAIVHSLWDLHNATSPSRASQLRALSFGLIAGTLPGVWLFAIPVVLGHSTIDTAWLPLLVFFFLVAMTYAVVLFELVEADLIIRRGLVYGLLTLAVVGSYVGLAVALAAGRMSVIGPSAGIGFVALTVLAGAAFEPVRRTIRRLVDWLVYGRRADRWDLLQELSARLGSVMQPDELGDVLVEGVVSALHLRGAFLLRREGSRFAVRSARTKDQDVIGSILSAEVVCSTLADGSRRLLLVHARPLTAGRRRSVPARFRPLDALHATLFLPLVTRSGLEAVLCLQPKLAHDAFGSEDLELLAPLVRQASIALDNALLFQRLEEKVQELQQAYARIAQEQELERARLGRELHDGTTQELAALITLASVVEKQLDPDHPACAALQRLRTQAEAAYQGVRRASHALRPLILHDLGLGKALQRVVAQFEETTGIVVRFQADDLGALPDDVELALLRVAQESLENVRKHSHATEAEILLRRADGHVRLSIADRGQGMPERGERGIGLAIMHERVEAVGGMLQVASSLGAGVTVEAAVPIRSDEG